MLCVHDALNSWSRSSSCRRKRQLDSSSFLSSFLPLYTWRTGHAPPARIFALSCWATGLSASNRKTILSSPLFFTSFFFYPTRRSTAPPYERQTELLCSLLLHAHVGAETVTESPLVSPLGGWRAVRTTLFYNEGDKVDARGISSTFLNIKRALIIFYMYDRSWRAGSWWSWWIRDVEEFFYFLTSSASITHRRVDDFPLENSPFIIFWNYGRSCVISLWVRVAERGFSVNTHWWCGNG